MSTMLERIRKRPHVSHVDDERNLGHSIIVTLENGFCYSSDPGCGVQGFDTVKDAAKGTRGTDVYKVMPDA